MKSFMIPTRLVLREAGSGMSKNESKDRQTVKNELTSAIRQSKEERKAITTELDARGPLTVPQLADATGLPPDEVLQHILVMMKSGQVVETGEKNGGYAYDVKR
ncbi:hypothetical protein [[Eubacterium] cellulosolvens]